MLFLWEPIPGNQKWEPIFIVPAKNEEEMNLIRYSEALEMLDVKSERTLRRWCALFEQHGWNFNKDDTRRRLFSEKDIELLRKLKEKSGSMKLEEVVCNLLEQIESVESNKLEERKGYSTESSSQTEMSVETITILLDNMQAYLEGDLLKVLFYCNPPDVIRKEIIERWNQFRSETVKMVCHKIVSDSAN